MTDPADHNDDKDLKMQFHIGIYASRMHVCSISVRIVPNEVGVRLHAPTQKFVYDWGCLGSDGVRVEKWGQLKRWGSN